MRSEQLSFFLPGTNGKGVLLIHGLTGAPAEMKLVARQLNRRGYSVHAPLLAGHGEDIRTLRRTHWEDWLASVVRGSEFLAERTQAVFAAGICVGGKLSLLAAKHRPDLIKAVAIYSPCFHYDGWDVPRHYTMLSPHIGWLSRVPFLDREFLDTVMGIDAAAKMAGHGRIEKAVLREADLAGTEFRLNSLLLDGVEAVLRQK